MAFKPYTPAVRMQRTAIMRKAASWYEEVGKEFGVTQDEIYLALLDFASLSLRMNGQKPKVDFQWVKSTDDSETIRTKFVGYLNTETTQPVWELEQAMQAFDAPANPDTAPEPSSDPEA